MVGRAVDVVVYQGYFEETNVRRVSEILELERPGVAISRGGGIEYRYRRLLDWQQADDRWTFTQKPSEGLLRSLQRRTPGMADGELGRTGVRW